MKSIFQTCKRKVSYCGSSGHSFAPGFHCREQPLDKGNAWRQYLVGAVDADPRRDNAVGLYDLQQLRVLQVSYRMCLLPRAAHSDADIYCKARGNLSSQQKGSALSTTNSRVRDCPQLQTAYRPVPTIGGIPLSSHFYAVACGVQATEKTGR